MLLRQIQRIRYKGISAKVRRGSDQLNRAKGKNEHIALAARFFTSGFERSAFQNRRAPGHQVGRFGQIIYFSISSPKWWKAKKRPLTKIWIRIQAKLKEVKARKKRRFEKLNAQSQGEWTLVLYRVLSEIDYYGLSMKYGEIFEAEGAESIYNIFKNINLGR